MHFWHSSVYQIQSVETENSPPYLRLYDVNSHLCSARLTAKLLYFLRVSSFSSARDIKSEHVMVEEHFFPLNGVFFLQFGVELAQ